MPRYGLLIHQRKNLFLFLFLPFFISSTAQQCAGGWAHAGHLVISNRWIYSIFDKNCGRLGLIIQVLEGNIIADAH